MKTLNYVLIRVEIDGNGVGDRYYHIAMSKSEQTLRNYCENELHRKVGKPEEFSWANYYLIETSNIEIL
jgi:hypothetical protein